MKRRTFIQHTTLTAVGVGITGLASAANTQNTIVNKLPRWRGFNLLDYFSPNKLDGSRGFTSDEELKWISDWGFDFLRIPMAYPRYIKFDPSKNITPDDVFLAWFEDVLSVLTENNIGWGLWEFKGTFGLLNSGRKDVDYENWHGYKLDKKLLTLLQKY